MLFLQVGSGFSRCQVGGQVQSCGCGGGGVECCCEAGCEVDVRMPWSLNLFLFFWFRGQCLRRVGSPIRVVLAGACSGVLRCQGEDVADGYGGWTGAFVASE
ncbi:hypothetical protein KC19_6G053600 [Ceratodon purpureus]|uniref:Uncharacterized protein n=1 Tax=Ceratodon purpureus TaxID=3225 RepID=A0A8T0HI04_CERPU|nr:hypothetical protein KC19_6G053600 [Ceratodon purpureus]